MIYGSFDKVIQLTNQRSNCERFFCWSREIKNKNNQTEIKKDERKKQQKKNVIDQRQDNSQRQKEINHKERKKDQRKKMAEAHEITLNSHFYHIPVLT